LEASVTQDPSTRICALSATVIALGSVVNSDPPSEAAAGLWDSAPRMEQIERQERIRNDNEKSEGK
jgi:hypothetical protein